MASFQFYHQRLSLAFYGCVLWVALTYGDKEILLSEPTKGQQWIWQSDAPWLSQGSPSVYSKCTIGSSDRFYIRTPFIKIPPSVGTVEVAIMYAIRNCSVGVPPGTPCSEAFDLYKYEQNKPLSLVRRELFTDKIKTIRAGPGECTSGAPRDAVKKSKDVIPVNVKSRGVYFAIIDKNACQALFSFEVSYRVCAKSVVNLVSYEMGNTVNGSCVANAEPSPNAPSVMQAVCNIDEEWNLDPNSSCVCKAGHESNHNRNECLLGNNSFI